MRWRRRHHCRLEDTLLTGIDLINTRLQLLEILMSAELDDLNVKVDDVVQTAHDIAARIAELKTNQGVPAADVAAAAAKLQPALDELHAALQP